MTKTCKKCGKEFPATTDYFVRNKSCKNGIEHTCKQCRQKYLSTRYGSNKESIRTKQKEYYESNKEKVLAISRNWRERNLEKMMQYKKDYAARNPDRRKKSVKKWEADNKETRRTYVRKRRAILRKLSEHHTAKDIEELFLEQEGKCYYCSTSIEESFHVDHMTPLSRGGSNTKENLCLSCPSCNVKKRDKTTEEFLELVA